MPVKHVPGEPKLRSLYVGEPHSERARMWDEFGAECLRAGRSRADVAFSLIRSWINMQRASREITEETDNGTSA